MIAAETKTGIFFLKAMQIFKNVAGPINIEIAFWWKFFF